MTVSFQIIRTK